MAQGRNGPRKPANGTVQTTGNAVPRPFGAAPKRAGRRKKNGNGNGANQSQAISRRARMLRYFDAFMPEHLPLPRGIAEYSVVRTTKVISAGDGSAQSGRKFWLFGPVFDTSPTDTQPRWTSIAAISNAPGKVDTQISNPDSGFKYRFPMQSAGWDSAKVVPAAFSVQIMNPEALQTTKGIFQMGRAKQVLNLRGDSRTWSQLATELISYSSPVLQSAASMAFNAVQCDCMPYNMSELSNFTGVSNPDGGDFAWGFASGLDLKGMAPIWVWNPDAVDLQFLVTCEWRVRFDPGNPAYATHTRHKVTSDSYWDKCVALSSSLGHGIHHVALTAQQSGEVVLNAAEAGVAAYGAYGALAAAA